MSCHFGERGEVGGDDREVGGESGESCDVGNSDESRGRVGGRGIRQGLTGIL